MQYGGQEVYDDFTTRFYWGRKCTDGTTLALSDAIVGGGGREAVSNEVWNKITAWFGDIAR